MKKKIFGIMFSLFFILTSTRSIEQAKWISYLVPIFFLYFLFLGFREIHNRELKLGLLIIIFFGLWTMVTAIWSPYPRESFIRGFVFIITSFSLVTAGYYWIKCFSKNDLEFLIPLNIFILLVSFFSLITKQPQDYWAGYGYGLKSYWGHQNILASLIIFTFPGILILPLKTKKIKIILTIILFSLNVYILILTHSRTSLLVLILSVLLFILLSKHFRVFWFIILLFTSVSALYIINKDFNSVLHNYLFKTETSFLDRKIPILSATFEAAGHGGWKGLGYGISDSSVEKNLQLGIHYHYEGARLVREKGSSLLALIEETGWVGLTLFLLIVGYLFYISISSYWKTNEQNTAILICVLFGMCLHAQLEGWWLGVGSVQFPMFMGMAGVMIGKNGNNPVNKS